MAEVRMDRIWEEAVAFVRAEAGLLMPVALAFLGLPALLASLAMPSAQAMQAGEGVGRVLLIGPIYGLLAMFAGLAIANLVLRRGERVADALEHASRRLGVAVLATLIVGAALLAAMTILAILLVVVALIGGVAVSERGTPGFTALTVVLVVVPILLLLIRLSTLWPRIATGGDGPLAAVTGAWRETGAVAWRLVLVTVLFNVTLQVALLAINFSLGSMAGLLAGSAATAVRVIAAVIGAGVGAVAGGFWAVFVACLHRALEPGRGDGGVSAVFE